MPLHSTTSQYLKPTDTQLDEMQACRDAHADYIKVLEEHVPDGPDKTYLLRKLREVGMWANIAITRLPDGSPRT